MPENPLRQEVEAAVLDEVERVGPDAFRPDQVIPRFLDRGASKPTLYRWIDACLNSGAPGAVATAKVKTKVAEIIARATDGRPRWA